MQLSCSGCQRTLGLRTQRVRDSVMAGGVRHRVASVDEFAPGTRVRVRIGSRSIAVFNVDGAYFAIVDRCPHQFAPLSRGRLQGTVICNAETNWETEWVDEGMVVACPGHGMEFDLRTGKAYGYALRIATYTVEVDSGEVYLIA